MKWGGLEEVERKKKRGSDSPGMWEEGFSGKDKSNLRYEILTILTGIFLLPFHGITHERKWCMARWFCFIILAKLLDCASPQFLSSIKLAWEDQLHHEALG